MDDDVTLHHPVVCVHLSSFHTTTLVMSRHQSCIVMLQRHSTTS
jgi:hypothetical protein